MSKKSKSSSKHLKNKAILCNKDVLHTYFKYYFINGGVKEPKKNRTSAAKSIKRARILGLLPFTHLNLAY